jgi:uncharacterized protein involved in exopolysaccharide biosynthesis
LKDQIARTQKMRDQMAASLAAKAAGGQPDSSPPEVSDASSPMFQIEGQVRANKVEIANRERSIAELKNKLAEYQSRLNAEPVREQQLADLTRGYDQTKANYDDLLKKRNESAMATSMELLQRGERFRIVDPPSLPVKPDFPNRMKFCGIGLAVGLALGTVVAGVAEWRDDRIYDETEWPKLLPVAIISEIPAIVTMADEEHERRRQWVGWAAAGVVSAVILAGSALSYLRS